DLIVADNDGALDKIYNQTVKKVTNDIENMRFNTAISQMMVFVNEVYKVQKLPKKYAEGFIKLLSPITPHIGEEIWQKLGHEHPIDYTEWPKYDENKLQDTSFEVAVQVNGKVRAHLTVGVDASKEDVQTLALENETVKDNLQDKTVKKVIVVPNKLVNIVAK
ncbi:class I tRNA ligase family protein, partial [Fructilactobacillus lindneri]